MLFAFGVLHFVLLWSGDVLALYAVVGLAAALIVPVLGAVQFRGLSLGPVFLVDAAFLLLGAVAWAVLGARWSRGRSEGRILRILTWLGLALPLLLLGGLVVLLLVFKPRLF